MAKEPLLEDSPDDHPYSALDEDTCARPSLQMSPHSRASNTPRCPPIMQLMLLAEDKVRWDGEPGGERPFFPYEILRHEEAYLKRRKQLCQPGAKPSHRPMSLEVGLALSGGGMRAAGQGIGALRFLKEKGLLKHIGYLSSVSGGGYTATGFLSHLVALKQQDQDQPQPRSPIELETVLGSALNSLEQQLEDHHPTAPPGESERCTDRIGCTPGAPMTTPYFRWDFFLSMFGAIFASVGYRMMLLNWAMTFIVLVLIPNLLIKSSVFDYLNVHCDESFALADSTDESNVCKYIGKIRAVNWQSKHAGESFKFTDMVQHQCRQYTTFFFPIHADVMRLDFDYSCYAPNLPTYQALVTCGILLATMFSLEVIRTNVVETKTWSGMFGLQSRLCSVLHAISGLLSLTSTMFSLMAALLLRFNSWAVSSAVDNNDNNWYFPQIGSDWVLFILISVALTFTQEVIQPLMTRSERAVGIGQLLLVCSFWFLFLELIAAVNSSTWLMLYVPNQQFEPWALGTVITFYSIVIVCLPFAKFLQSAAGFCQQPGLTRQFYHPWHWQSRHEISSPRASASQTSLGREMYMSEVNLPEWPIPPVYICNTTQHDLVDAREGIAAANKPLTYTHFEITGHHWGSHVTGYWKIPKTLRMSTAMAQSGAATSSTVGNKTPEGPIAEVALGALVVLGMETGRYHTLVPEAAGKKKIHELRSKDRKFDISLQRIPEIAMVTVMMVMMVSLAIACYYSVQANLDGIPIDYGRLDGFVGVIFNQPGPVGVVYFTNDTDPRADGTDSPLSATKCEPNCSPTSKPISWLNYLARFADTDRILCPTQNSWNSPPNDCHGTLRTLRDQAWYSETKRWFAIPRTNQQENFTPWKWEKDWNVNTWEHTKCVHKSYQWLNQLVRSKIPDLHKGASETRRGELHEGASEVARPHNCSWCTACHEVAYMSRAIVYGRFKCYDEGEGRGIIIQIGTFVLYFTLICFCICYIAPAFPGTWWCRWALFSKFFQLITRSMRHNIVVSNPTESGVPEVFLADGGHLDNSAILPLLKRQCKCIIAVDGEGGRKCSTVYQMISQSRRFANCSFSIPHSETRIAGSFEDMMLDFKLPRARYTGDGMARARNNEELFERMRKVRLLMTGRGRFPCGGEGGSGFTVKLLQKGGEIMKRLTTHHRVRDDHVYIYFKDDKSVCTAFKRFDFINENFKVCQYVDDPKGKLKPEWYLPEDVIRAQTVRNVMHLKVHYTNGEVGDIYILRGEMGPETIAEKREMLKKWETVFATKGKFPNHATGIGEGHSWEHMNAYAEYARLSAEQAWNMEDGMAQHFSSGGGLLTSKVPSAIEALNQRGYTELAELFKNVHEGIEECIPASSRQSRNLEVAGSELQGAEAKLLEDGLIEEVEAFKAMIKVAESSAWRTASRETQLNPEKWVS